MTDWKPALEIWWTVSEIASAINRTNQYVLDRIKGRQQPKLAAKNVEGRWFIRDSDARNFVKDHRI